MAENLNLGGIIQIADASQSASRALDSLGNQISKIGKQYHQKMQNALNTAEYTKSLNDATSQFNDAIYARESQRVDENGNPTFDTLPSDVEKIGNSILDQTANNIKNSDVRDQFRNNFSTHILAKSYAAQGVKRQEQIRYAKSQLNDGVQGLVNNAIQDSVANVPYYSANINKIANESFDAGIITESEKDRFVKASNRDIVVGQYQKLMKSDPNLANNSLKKNSAQSLGITENEHQKLSQQATAAVSDQNYTNSQAKAAQENINKEQSNVLETQMNLGLRAGKTGTSDIIKARDQGKLSDLQALNLMATSSKVKLKGISTAITNQGISDALANNESTASFSTSQINKHYQNRINYLSSQTGKKPDLVQQAAVGVQYKRPLSPLQKEVEFSVMNGSPIEQVQALQAYDFVKDSQSTALNGLNVKGGHSESAKVGAVLSTASELSRYTSLNDQEAMQRAKSIVLVPDDVKKFRSTQFNKVKNFKFDALDSTLESTYSDKYPFWSSRSGGIDDNTKYIMHDLLKDYYAITGDEDQSKAMLKNNTDGLVGVTNINLGHSIAGEKKSKLMYLAPETMFPHETSEQLQENLLSSAKPYLPKGIDSSRVGFSVDSLSDIPGKNNKISYPLYYTTKENPNEKIPLVDENGYVRRWTPDAVDNDSRKIQESINKRNALIKDKAGKKLLDILKQVSPEAYSALSINERIDQ